MATLRSPHAFSPTRQAILTATIALLLATLFLSLSPAALAQAPPGPIHLPPGVQPEKSPPPGANPSNIPAAQRPLRVRVTEVTAPVTARDEKGEVVLSLTQKDFRIFDNGKEQTIDHFDMGGDPLAVVLLVETSSRIEALLPAVRKSGIVFTQTVMAGTGDAAVVSYDDDISVRRKFTGDQDSIQSTINKLPEGTSGARLYDGISKSITLLKKQPPRLRRIVVVMGEAVDSGSETKLGAALREAELANVTIYTIGLSTTAAEFRNKPKDTQPIQMGPPGTFPVPVPAGIPETPLNEAQMQGNIDLLALAVWVVQHASNAVADHALEVATEATGGRHIRTMKDRSIEKAMDAIGGELHTQYTLSYKPAGAYTSGFHDISVTVDRPGVKLRTRPGYYIPSESDSSETDAGSPTPSNVPPPSPPAN